MPPLSSHKMQKLSSTPHRNDLNLLLQKVLQGLPWILGWFYDAGMLNVVVAFSSFSKLKDLLSLSVLEMVFLSRI